MRFSLTNNMPLRKDLPSWGEGKGNTQTYGGTDGYKLLEREIRKEWVAPPGGNWTEEGKEGVGLKMIVRNKSNIS